MINPNDFEKVKNLTREFFKTTTFEVDISFSSPKDSTIPINIQTPHPKALIGEGGQTLVYLQHLLKAILKKSIKDNFYINLDINGYKEKKTQYLKELASSVADEVALSRKEKILPPMPAYERRIIHLELAERTDVATESMGREPERRIMIKPYP